MDIADALLFDVLARRSLAKLNTFSEHGLNSFVWALIRADLPPFVDKSNFLTTLKSYVCSSRISLLRVSVGPPLSQIERQCADIISTMVPRSSANRYCFGIELDVVIEWDDQLINVEIDGPHHRMDTQRRIDARRDLFLRSLGVRVVRVDVSDKCIAEISTDLKNALRSVRLLAD